MKTCNHCGHTFKPYNSLQAHCSKECKAQTIYFKRWGRYPKKREPEAKMEDLTLADHVRFRSFFDLLHKPVKKERTCNVCRGKFTSKGNRTCPTCHASKNLCLRVARHAV